MEFENKVLIWKTTTLSIKFAGKMMEMPYYDRQKKSKGPIATLYCYVPTKKVVVKGE